MRQVPKGAELEPIIFHEFSLSSPPAPGIFGPARRVPQLPRTIRDRASKVDVWLVGVQLRGQIDTVEQIPIVFILGLAAMVLPE
jgi:hypothetical protein